MSQSSSTPSSPSDIGFKLGFIFGLTVGFVLALIVYKKNKKTFDLISQKFDQLLKDFLLPQKPKPSFSSVISSPRRRAKPRTFNRGKK